MTAPAGPAPRATTTSTPTASTRDTRRAPDHATKNKKDILAPIAIARTLPEPRPLIGDSSSILLDGEEGGKAGEALGLLISIPFLSDRFSLLCNLGSWQDMIIKALP